MIDMEPEGSLFFDIIYGKYDLSYEL